MFVEYVIGVGIYCVYLSPLEGFKQIGALHPKGTTKSPMINTGNVSRYFLLFRSTYKSPMNRKENDLKQTFMTLLFPALNLRGQ